MVKKVVLEFFPEEYIALSKELLYHPLLQDQLAQVDGNEFELRLAIVAAYCGVIMDGAYVQADFIKLADILRNKLVAARIGVALH